MNRFLLASALCLFASIVAAQEAGGYIGGSFGGFFYEENVSGFGRYTDTTDEIAIYGGYRFGKRWGVEATSRATGDLNFTIFIPQAVNVRADYSIGTVMGIIYANKFFFGFGDYAAQLHETVSSGSSSAYLTDDNSGGVVRIGGQWDLDNVSLRVTYDVFESDLDTTVATIAGGVHYRF